MKRLLTLVISCLILFSLLCACVIEKTDPSEIKKKAGKIFYVATNGNDENEGTKDAPLASIYGAVAKVREYKQSNGLPEGGIKVEFASGTYKLTSSVIIGAQDSGESGKPIVYAAAEGAEVIFDGGITLNPTDFKPANDDFKSRLYSDEAKNNVLEIDLVAAGLWDADDSKTYCLGATGYTCTWVYRQSMYVNNELQNVARWPNEGYGETEVIEEYNGTSTLLKIPSDRADLWDKETGVRLYGYPTHDWSANFTWDTHTCPGSGGIAVDTEYKSGRPYFFFNIATELDSPGEYYWDVSANKLYYWPKEGFESSKISFSQLYDPGIDVSGCSFVSFDGLYFESFRNSPIYGEDSTDITISNSVFRGNSRSIWFRGYRITIDSNEFYNLGGGAIYIDGGDYSTLVPSDSLVTNNRIHDFAQVYTVYNAGIILNGLGYTITHNEIYNAPHSAILFWCGMTTIEYNDIHDVCRETSDAGAVYSGHRWDWGNTVIRYNYIHNIIDVTHNGGPNGIYLDDMLAKITCYGNILVNIGGNGFAIGGGRNLSIYNNVLINTYGINFDERGYGWYPTSTSYPEGYLWINNVASNYLTDLWKYTQPEYLSTLEMRTTDNLRHLRGIVEGILDSPGPASYADIHGNIGYNNARTVSYNGNDNIFYPIEYLCLNIFIDDDDDYTDPPIGSGVYAFGNVSNNLSYSDNLEDVFVDPANENFFLRDDSRVYRDIIGFEKWDYNLIGINK